MKKHRITIGFVLGCLILLTFLVIRWDLNQQEIYSNELPPLFFQLSKTTRYKIRDCIAFQGYSFYGDWSERTDAPKEVINKCMNEVEQNVLLEN